MLYPQFGQKRAVERSGTWQRGQVAMPLEAAPIPPNNGFPHLAQKRAEAALGVLQCGQRLVLINILLTMPV
jgi:hypothetical protein